MADDNDPDFSEDGDGIKNLRKNRDELAAQVKELRDQLAAREKAERDAQLAQILKAKGLTENAAKHYTGEATEEAVTAWASDLGLLQEEPPDPNAEAAGRLAAGSADTASLYSAPVNKQGGQVAGRPVLNPQELLARMSTPGFTYEDGVQLGIFPVDPSRTIRAAGS